MGEKEVSICHFLNMRHLVRVVMRSPNKAECFTHSQWSIVLMGSSSWAANEVYTATTIGLYDQVSYDLQLLE